MSFEEKNSMQFSSIDNIFDYTYEKALFLNDNLNSNFFNENDNENYNNQYIHENFFFSQEYLECEINYSNSSIEERNTEIYTKDLNKKKKTTTIRNDLNSFDKNKEKEKMPIFEIKKENKNFNRVNDTNVNKRGRRNKGNNLPFTKNSKKRPDNIIQKIKRKFTWSTMKTINRAYNLYRTHKNLKSMRLLQKIRPIFSKIIKFEDNLKYMKKTVREMFSEKLSERCIKFDNNYNKVTIDKVYEMNEAKEVIKILNYTIEEIYKIYIGKSDEKIPEYGLEYDLKEIEEKESKDYAEMYKNLAISLIQKFGGGGRKSY